MKHSVEPLSETFGAVVNAERPGADPLELDPAELQSLLARRGAVLLRGFGLDVPGLIALSDRFLRRAVVHGGERKQLSDDDTVQSVTEGNGDVELHAELGYVPLRPDLLWFYCEQPPIQGGETTLCDGVELLERLSERSRRLFSDHRVEYVRTYQPPEWRRAFKIQAREELERILEQLPDVKVSFNPDGSFEGTYVTRAVVETRYTRQPAYANSVQGPYIHRTYLEGGRPIPAEALEEVLQVARRIEVPVAWRRQDAVLIDNSRVMHGRRAFPANSERLIYARFGQACF